MKHYKDRKLGNGQMNAKSIREKIKILDEKLDNEEITDEEYERINKQIVCLCAKLGRAEREEERACIEDVKKVSQWEASFLKSFKVGTHTISNRQAECFKRINRGKPFKYCGRLYSCSGANYRVGFSHVMVESLAE